MELPILRLDRAARPTAEGLKSIRDHPAYCYVCTNFDYDVANTFLEGEGLWIDKRLHSVTRTSTMLELTQAADEGCASCKVLKSIAENLGNGAFDPESDDELTVTYWEGTTMTFQLGDYTSKDHLFELFTGPGAPRLWSTIGNDIVAVDPATESWQVPGGQASIVPQDPLSDTSILRIKDWIAKCKQDHPYCGAHQGAPADSEKPRYCPKRLIEVGSDKGDARLVETNGIPVEYVALSYCWGNSKGLNLLKSNEQAFCHRLPVEDLLKTHQDAIAITRKLGFRNLWTDALCIRQDDNAEKAIEIANMDSVYSGAYLTIAGTSARHGDQGCLGQRTQTYKLPMVDEHGKLFEIFVRRQIPHVAWDWDVPDAFSPAARNLFTADPAIMKTYPLFDRAWCFQERLLSTRTVHFTAHEVVWECLGMTCCECGTMDDFVGSRTLRERRFALGVPQDIEIRCGKLERSRKLAGKLGLLGYGRELGSFSPAIRNDYALMCAILGHEFETDESNAERGQRWRDLVTQYSRRSLSFDSDALPAVSGLAKAWVAAVKQRPEYLAGLWEDDLLRGMLWKCIDENPKARPTTFLAPTWSWASVRRTIDWLAADSIEKQPVYHVTIEDATCETSTINPFGEVRGGRIVVKGSVVGGTVTAFNDSGPAILTSASETSIYFKADCIPEAQGMIGQDVCCLWWSTDVNDARTGMGWERALVLKPSPLSAPDTYARVGIMEHFPAQAWGELLEEKTLTIL